MEKTAPVKGLLDALRVGARQHGWTDRDWAARAGLPAETLSRLGSRSDCSLSTLNALAAATGMSVQLATPTTEDGLWPALFDRALEERLLRLVTSGDLTVREWRACGPSYFMAGLAQLLAAVTPQGEAYRNLAESLHPGASTVPVFQRWLDGTPLSLSRFLSMRETYGHSASPSR